MDLGKCGLAESLFKRRTQSGQAEIKTQQRGEGANQSYCREPRVSLQELLANSRFGWDAFFLSLHPLCSIT